MNKQNGPKGFVSRLAAFVMGWGFYIVLFLCVAVVGISAWSLISAGKKAGEALTDGLDSVVTSPGSSYTAEDFNLPDMDVDMDTLAEPEPPAIETPEAEKPAEAAEVNAPAAEPEPSEEAPAPEPLYFIWPLNGGVQQPYAVESLVYNKTMDDWRSHNGVDITSALGTKVAAAARGTVESIYTDALYGTTVVISHGDGLESLYCNLAATPTVAEGDSVNVGDVIGAVGDTALIEVGDAGHLHFEIRQDGVPTDPTGYLPER